jgi:hypothetical protein
VGCKVWACVAYLEVDRLGAAAGERGVKDTREGGDDGTRVDALRDEVHVHEVVADVLVVAVDEVRDGLDHAEALILGHLGHQPKVENDESAVGRAQPDVGRARANAGVRGGGVCVCVHASVCVCVCVCVCEGEGCVWLSGGGVRRWCMRPRTCCPGAGPHERSQCRAAA